MHVALGHQSSRKAGSVLVRPRGGFSRSHACTRRKAAGKIILSSCGGSNKLVEKLGILFPVPTVYVQQRLSRSGSVGAGLRAEPHEKLHPRLKGAEPGGA